MFKQGCTTSTYLSRSSDSKGFPLIIRIIEEKFERFKRQAKRIWRRTMRIARTKGNLAIPVRELTLPSLVYFEQFSDMLRSQQHRRL